MSSVTSELARLEREIADAIRRGDMSEAHRLTMERADMRLWFALNSVYTTEGVDIWLHGRNRALEGQRPIDLLAAGEFEVVLAEIERLRGGPA